MNDYFFSTDSARNCYPSETKDNYPTNGSNYLNKYKNSLYLSSSAPSYTLPPVPFGIPTAQVLVDAGFTGIFVTGDNNIPNEFKIEGCEAFDNSIVLCAKGLPSTNFNWNGVPLSYLKSVTTSDGKDVVCSYNATENKVCDAGINQGKCQKTPDSSSPSRSLTGGQIAGIVVGSIAFVFIVGAVAYFLRRRYKRKPLNKEYREWEKYLAENQSGSISNNTFSYGSIIKSTPIISDLASLDNEQVTTLMEKFERGTDADRINILNTTKPQISNIINTFFNTYRLQKLYEDYDNCESEIDEVGTKVVDGRIMMMSDDLKWNPMDMEIAFPQHQNGEKEIIFTNDMVFLDKLSMGCKGKEAKAIHGIISNKMDPEKALRKMKWTDYRDWYYQTIMKWLYDKMYIGDEKSDDSLIGKTGTGFVERYYKFYVNQEEIVTTRINSIEKNSFSLAVLFDSYIDNVMELEDVNLEYLEYDNRADIKLLFKINNLNPDNECIRYKERFNKFTNPFMDFCKSKLLGDNKNMTKIINFYYKFFLPAGSGDVVKNTLNMRLFLKAESDQSISLPFMKLVVLKKYDIFFQIAREEKHSNDKLETDFWNKKIEPLKKAILLSFANDFLDEGQYTNI